jgi:hypothetical protein
MWPATVGRPGVSYLIGTLASFSEAKHTVLPVYFKAFNDDISNSCFLVPIVEGGVQLGPLGTSATNWPTVPAPGDYKDGEFGGMMIERGNRSTRRKLVPVPLCPPQIPHDLTGSEPRPPRWEASN